MTQKTIYTIAALVVIAGVIWYVMRAQRQAAIINGAAAPATTPTVPGAST